jgi:hypothetical protein
MRHLPLFAVFASVLLISGCGTKAKEEKDCSGLLDRKLRSECLYNNSILLLNPVACKDIPDMKVREKCVSDVSVRLDNEMYCSNLDRLSAKEACEQEVAYARRLKKAGAPN